MEFFETIITDKAKKYVNEVLDSEFLSEGTWTELFEMELKKKFGFENFITVNSGTSALHLALSLLRLKRNDEVIIPAQTFIATGLAVKYINAKIVFADIDKYTGCLTLESIQSKVTDRTKAIIVVHWGGSVNEIDKIHNYCKSNGLFLIEDSAHALGSIYNGRIVGNKTSHMSCFSYQSIKHLSTADGGGISFRDKYFWEQARKLRWFGIDRWNDKADETGERVYNLNRVGYKYHLNNLCSALGLGNLDGIEQRIAQRRRIADIYNQELYGFSGIEQMKYDKFGYSSYWLYPILVEKRKDLFKKFKAFKIPYSVVHVGIDRNDIFGGKDYSLENQRYWDEHQIHLPINSKMTEDDAYLVCEVLKNGWN